MLTDFYTETQLHSADMELVARRLVELACAETGTTEGAVFLHDAKLKGLSVDFHMVGGVIVALPGTGTVLRPRRGRPNGIALTCFERGRPYACNDTSQDPNYARYFLEVAAVLAVPIPWQGRPMGVLTVSSSKRNVFGPSHVVALERLAQTSAKFLRRAQLARATRDDAGRPFVIKGLSPEWMEVERRIEQVSATDAPVLVQGESGTGKDLVARAIHFNSKRASRPFVTVNCAAIPETMLESVLFGHLKGAFTGASFHKLGELQKADGGTLFLDELGELPLLLQAKVLRALEQGEVTPLGSNEPPARVDVRILCATNRDLPAMVREGRFRDDLYYRVGLMTIELPPLRSYKENLTVLAQVFLHQAAERHGRPVGTVTKEAMALLQAYDFPGNVRELKNAIEHAVILSGNGDVRPDDLPRSMSATRVPAARLDPPVEKPDRRTLAQMREEWLAPLERQYLFELIERCGGRVSEAAREAGVNRVTFYRLMGKRGVRIRRGASASSSGGAGPSAAS
ncbi:MAG: sigma-54-dependent Fis family transcriptional regulator [Myxococcales bacterium]|nr:sigma-54-dependent Fis family transcriptional regulator [Myxococcales bacterium]